MGKPDETFYIKLDAEPKLVTTLNCKTLYNALLRAQLITVTGKNGQIPKVLLTGRKFPRTYKRTILTVKQMIFDRKSCIGVYQLLED